MKNKILLLVVAFALPLTMWANNIRVKLNNYNPTTKALNVTVAWDNSWHDGSGQLRDAAYIFVKYKDVTNSEWQHAILTTTPNTILLADTINPVNVKFDLVPKNPSTAPVGNRGYIIRRKMGTGTAQNNPEYVGVYNVAMTTTFTLVLPAGVNLLNPEFRVYGLEMVDVPMGPYYLGDGLYGCAFSSTATGNAPILVNTDNSFNAYTYIGISGNMNTYTVAYPRGFTEYFVMKYELSNEGYTEFLNTLTRTQQDIFVAGNTGGLANGVHPLDDSHSLGINVTVTGPADAMSFSATYPYIAASPGLSGSTLAYLDWAGLRPMSAMEYEKACRGPLQPVAGEYAWGSAVVTPVISSPDIDLHGANESYTNTISGPFYRPSYSTPYPTVRCGAFAKATGSTRLNTGGTYYGIMEMSGNANEIVIYDVNYRGALGDGILTTFGRADVTDWTGINTSNGAGTKGGFVSGPSSSLDLSITTYDLGYYAIRGVIK